MKDDRVPPRISDEPNFQPLSMMVWTGDGSVPPEPDYPAGYTEKQKAEVRATQLAMSAAFSLFMGMRVNKQDKYRRF